MNHKVQVESLEGGNHQARWTATLPGVVARPVSPLQLQRTDSLIKHVNPSSDVQNTAPNPTIVNPIRDGWMGKQVAERLGISAPFSNEDLVNFFTVVLHLYDETHPPPVRQLPNSASFPKRITTPEIDEFVKQRSAAGLPSGAIRAEVSQHFGVDLSASHMSHMRKRLAAKDTL